MFRKTLQFKYLLITCFIFSATGLHAQKFNVAVKLGGGLAYQHISNDDILAINTVGSLSLGGMATYSLPYLFELQGGLALARKGAVIVEDAITTRQRVTTIDLPLSLVKNFTLPGLGTLYAGGGGYFAMAVGGNLYYETPSSSTSDRLEYGNDKDLQRYDTGLNFTTGLKLNNRLLFDISYQLGLKNLATTRLKDTGTSEVNSRMFTASLGYIFK